MKKWLSSLYIFFVFAFLYAPILILIIFSFNASKSRVWTGFSLEWYQKLFSNELILSSLVNTVIVALVASVFATILGTTAALGMHKMKKVSRNVIKNVTYLQILNPEIVTGISLMLLFAFFKMTPGFVTLILAHITFCVPTVVFSVLPKLRQMNKSIYEAALDLGCNPFRAFLKVVIPEIMPGIVTGFLMALTYSIDDFVISYFTSGPTSQTLPVTIYAMTKKKISPEINALSTLMFVVVLAVLIIINVRDQKKEKAMQKKFKFAGSNDLERSLHS